MLYRALLTLPVAACAENLGQAAEAAPATPSAALVGRWVRLAPSLLRGDTLQLAADSTAAGLVLVDGTRAVPATYWVVRSGSTAPTNAPNAGPPRPVAGGADGCAGERMPARCHEMPRLCIGDRRALTCTTYVYIAPNFLLLPDGSRFVRALRRPAHYRARFWQGHAG